MTNCRQYILIFQRIQFKHFNYLLFYNRTSHIRSKGEGERDVLQKQVRVRRRDGYVAAEKRQRNMSVELCCVERHDVIGENWYYISRTILTKA